MRTNRLKKVEKTTIDERRLRAKYIRTSLFFYYFISTLIHTGGSTIDVSTKLFYVCFIDRQASEINDCSNLF